MTTFTPNKGQGQAIGAPARQPVRVVAGAGTGKTEVISRRYIHLLQQNPSWRPEHILVLTFSEKAAAEMRARIFRSVAQAGLGYARLDLASAAISTFHSFSARLLGDYSLRAGIDSGLPLLSEIDVQTIIAEAQEVFLSDAYATAYGDYDPLVEGDWKEGGPFELAYGLIGQLRNQAVDPLSFRIYLSQVPDSGSQRLIGVLVDWLYQAYTTRLAERGQLDFDRLILEAGTLLETQMDVQVLVHGRFRAILVDEYQDTNLAQEKLLRALADPQINNVTVVGDPRQAIYVWREARVENIARFRGANGLRVDAPLTENRRSLSPILEVANRAIAGYELDLEPEFDPSDILIPSQENLEFSGTVVDLQASPTREAEAEAIVGWIQESRGAGYGYRHIAIILRARTYLNIYLGALEQAGIPYEVSTADAFFTRPEILDAIHLLRVCLDPADELSLARVLLSPVVGLSQARLASFKRSNRQPLWQNILSPGDATEDVDTRGRLETFTAFWQVAQRERWLLPPAQFVAWVIQQSGLLASVDTVGQRSLSKLQAVAHDYEASHGGDSVQEMATYLRLVLEGDPRAKAPELNSDAEAVQILTAHASKGLEFPVVIAADSRQKVKPNRDKAPFHEPSAGLVFPGEDEDSAEFVTRVRRSRNEARCLWYVTLTRAKRRLIITAANDEPLENGLYAKENTFFEELWNRVAAAPTPGVQLGEVLQASELAPQARAKALSERPWQSALAMKVQLAARLVRPKPTFRISPTAFLRYRHCAAAYRFYYQSGLAWLPVSDDEDRVEYMSGGPALGSFFHAAVAAQASHPKATAGELSAYAERELQILLPIERKLLLNRWLTGYLASDLGQIPPLAQSVERSLSWEFNLPTANLVLSGFADRLEAGRLIDYKTDKDGTYLVEHYGDQLRVYAILGEQLGLLQPLATLMLYHAPTAKVMDVSWTEVDKSRLLNELEEFAHWLTDDLVLVSPTPGEQCRWCTARETVCGVGHDWAAAHSPI